VTWENRIIRNKIFVYATLSTTVLTYFPGIDLGSAETSDVKPRTAVEG